MSHGYRNGICSLVVSTIGLTDNDKCNIRDNSRHPNMLWKGSLVHTRERQAVWSDHKDRELYPCATVRWMECTFGGMAEENYNMWVIIYLLPLFVPGSGPTRSIPTLCHTFVTAFVIWCTDTYHSTCRTLRHLHGHLSSKNFKSQWLFFKVARGCCYSSQEHILSSWSA